MTSEATFTFTHSPIYINYNQCHAKSINLFKKIRCQALCQVLCQILCQVGNSFILEEGWGKLHPHVVLINY